MKFSNYDLKLRAECLVKGIKPPSKPEQEYAWDAGKPCLLDPANPAWFKKEPGSYKDWGKNQEK